MFVTAKVRAVRCSVIFLDNNRQQIRLIDPRLTARQLRQRRVGEDLWIMIYIPISMCSIECIHKASCQIELQDLAAKLKSCVLFSQPPSRKQVSPNKQWLWEHTSDKTRLYHNILMVKTCEDGNSQLDRIVATWENKLLLMTMLTGTKAKMIMRGEYRLTTICGQVSSIVRCEPIGLLWRGLVSATELAKTCLGE